MGTPNMKSEKSGLETKVRFFDLEKFQNDTLTVPYSYTDETDLEAAKGKIEEKDLLEAINDLLRRKAMFAARAEALKGKSAADRKIVNNFVANFAQIPPFDSLPDGTKDERKAKRDRILASIRSMPLIFEGLKAKALASPVPVEDDSTEEDDEK